MRTHFIRDKELNTYFRACDAETIPNLPDAKDKSDADLYEQNEAVALATTYYGPDGYAKGKWEIIEATLKEFHSWRGRQGGRAGTDKQNRQRRRAGERYGGRPRVCHACGKATIPARTRASVTVCVECQGL